MGEPRLEDLVAALARACARATSDEDVRVATAALVDAAGARFGLTFSGEHERPMLSGGRADSVYRHVVFGYERPGYLRTAAGVRAAVLGRASGTGGLARHLTDLAIEQAGNAETFARVLRGLVGVGFDGERFVFVRFVPGPDTAPLARRERAPAWLPATIPLVPEHYALDDLRAGARRLVLFLRATRRQPLTAETLKRAFGGRSAHAATHLPALHALLEARLAARQPELDVRYGEWERIFGIVYGELSDARPDVLQDVRRTYPWVDARCDLKHLVFSLHTYYNAVLKLVVAALVAATKNPFFLARDRVLDLDDAAFRAWCVALLDGDFFAEAGLPKLFHESYFEWIQHAWTPAVAALFRDALRALDELEPAIAVVGPEFVRDVVKDTYEAVVPRKLRHLMGEYFTPDWLAEHTLDTVGYTGEPGATLLDPTCGSGTFLVQAIKKKRARLPDDAAFARDVLATVVGFDINPISVTSAKVNVLLALGDAIQALPEVRIPIYLCDSVLTPTVHARQVASDGNAEIRTVAGTFAVPARDRAVVEAVLDRVEDALAVGATRAEFERGLRASPPPPDRARPGEPPSWDTTAPRWSALYEQLRQLRAERRDGIWCDLLRNQFAPLFVEHAFDYVVGNPPWVSWRNMSADYRATTVDIWLSYGIFEKSAYDARTTHDDLAMAVTYVAADHFLKDGGRLAFVLSQSFFKSKKGGEGFRKFDVTRDGAEAHLEVLLVDDMNALNPFPGVANRTAVLALKKGPKTAYPVPYRRWTKRDRGAIPGDAALAWVRARARVTELVATPIDEADSRSPWLTVPAPLLAPLRGLLGKSPYRGRKGIEPLGAKAVFFLKPPVRAGGGRVRVVNDLSRGRYPAIDAKGELGGEIEADLVFPMLSGRNIDRWGLNSHTWAVFPHVEARGPHNAIPLAEMRARYPRTLAWLAQWEPELLATRARNGKFYDPTLDPFYLLDNVGLYTFAPYKVVWCEQGAAFTACVVSELDDPVLGRKRVLVDSKVLYCPLEDRAEAHYLAALLNSESVRSLVDAYTLDTQRGIDVLEMIALPRFDAADPRHAALVELSELAHVNHADPEVLAPLEARVDALAATLLGLPDGWRARADADAGLG